MSATMCLSTAACAWLVCAALACGCAGRERAPDAAHEISATVATLVAPLARTAQVGKLALDRQARRAEVGAQVILREGILDYLCVLPNSGKEYESLLELDCKAASLHAALLALGARPGSIDPAFGFKHRGDPDEDNAGKPPGDRVRIMLRWRSHGIERSAPVETWLLRRATRRAPEPLCWVFTGSFLVPAPDGEGRVYLADMEKVAVAVLYHGACVLNLADAAGSPYAAADKGFEINPAAVPPLGTRVTVVFQVEAGPRNAEKEP